MLSTVTVRGIVLISCLVLVAGCASTVNGTGSAGGGPGGGSASTHDFPSDTASGGASAPASASAGGSGASSAPSAPARSRVVRAGDGTTYVVRIWADVKNATCADHAYGRAVITFLKQHPCHGLERLLATTSVNGRTVGFAESSTGFPGPASDPYKYSAEFAKLEKSDGTGSLNDLLREGYRLPVGPTQVPRHEAFTVIGQDDGVTVWDSWYLSGTTPDDDPALIKMCRDLFLRL